MEELNTVFLDLVFKCHEKQTKKALHKHTFTVAHLPRLFSCSSWQLCVTLLSSPELFLAPPSLQNPLRHLHSCCISAAPQSSYPPSISSFPLSVSSPRISVQTHPPDAVSFSFSCLRSTDSSLNPAFVPWAADGGLGFRVFMFGSLTIICLIWKHLITSAFMFKEKYLKIH